MGGGEGRGPTSQSHSIHPDQQFFPLFSSQGVWQAKTLCLTVSIKFMHLTEFEDKKLLLTFIYTA